MESMELVFVYGTLRNSNVQRKVIGRSQKGEKAVLRDYRRSRISIDGRIYPVAASSIGSLIEGSLIWVSEEEMEKIDKYETNRYRRQYMIVGSRRALVYVKNQ